MSHTISFASQADRKVQAMNALRPLVKDAVQKATALFVEEHGVSELRKVCTPVSEAVVRMNIAKSA